MATQALRFDNAGCSWVYPWGGFRFLLRGQAREPSRARRLSRRSSDLSLTWPTEVMAREKEPQQIDLEALATARMIRQREGLQATHDNSDANESEGPVFV